MALLVALFLVGLGVLGARHLELNANLTELLPRSFKSVQDLDKLDERFGGMGYVVVVGENAEPAKLQQFADDVAPGLTGLPSIRWVDFRRASKFFVDHGLYYLEKEDLETIANRIDERMAFERRQRNPLFVQLDEEEEAPSLDFKDIQKKYTGSSAQRLAGDGGDYFLDPNTRMVVLLAKPATSSGDLAYSKKMIGETEDFLKTIDTKKYGPDFKISITGTFKKKLDQQRQITHDLALASSVATVLLLLYLLFHFRSFLAVGFVLVPVLAGVTVTYGIVGAVYGQVNLLTGFLGAILGGLGVEHGIHLLGRYEALRSKGETSEEATRDAFTHTGGAALISSVVAALTFLSLSLSEFRAFREFGVIAAMGMIILVASYVLILPALLGVASRLKWKPTSSRTVTGQNSELAHLIPKYAKQITVVMGAIMLLLCVTVRDVRFNYDFASLEDSRLPSFQLDRKTNKLLGYSQTPVIVLTESTDSEKFVVSEINKRKEELGDQSTIDFVAALEDLVPKDQGEKRLILDRMQATLDKFDPQKYEGEQRELLDRAKTMVEAEPFSRADLPANVKRQFQGTNTNNENGGFVLIFPGISLGDGTKVRQFAKEVRDIKEPNGETLSASGEAMVLADILEMISREAWPILLAALVSVILAMWVTLGSLRTALVCLLPTVASILALVGLMPLMGVEFNYLNMVIVPVLIGVTVDAGVHLVSRLSEAGADFSSVYGEVGRAICGGLLTSAVGFGALLLADHPGLNSLGKIANLGFATNLLAMLVGFPAVLALLAQWRLRAAAQKPVRDGDEVAESRLG